MHPKVFGVGLHKTGTSTLRECLRILGFSVCPEEIAYATRKEAAIGSYQDCLNVAKHFDAFEDSPWNYNNVYRILDATFPSARFVLTLRDPLAWHRSILRWVSLHGSAQDINIISTLGGPVLPDNEREVVSAYSRHTDSVVRYFDQRDGKLLVVDWAVEPTWDKLCAFLALPIPDAPFPHVLRYDESTVSYVNA